MSSILQHQSKSKLTTFHNFANVPGCVGQLIPDTRSGPIASTTRRNIDREEPCFITKSSCYTHVRAHWVSAARKTPIVNEEVERLLSDRRIVRPGFKLNDTSNLSNLDCTLHAALEEHAFFAVTGSLTTLKQLIVILKADNDCRQERFDITGNDRLRILNLQHPAITNPQYELVVLRPHHMLPNGKVLVSYSRDASGVVSHKTYVPSIDDNTLHEFPGTSSCPRFPPFSSDHPRPEFKNLNPFLVILNADIKFRRYLRQRFPPPLDLPPDVMNLINLTLELVEQIYWDPVIRPNTPAALMKADRSSPLLSSDEGIEDEDRSPDEKSPTTQTDDGEFKRPSAGASLEERMEDGQYLLSGRDLPFDSDDEDLLREMAAEYKNAHLAKNATADRVDGEVDAWRKTIV